MARKEDYIAVFDSGIGGISVLRELMRLMPGERYLYFGDSANAPYGARTTEQVRALTLAAAEKLFDRGVKALVVACNTATAAAIDLLRQTYPDRIIVGIEPAVKVAAEVCIGGNIGVMATPLTLREEKFNQLLERFDNVAVTPISAPELVGLIESGAPNAQIEDYLQPILAPYRGKLDAVVLGCTHYPFVSGIIGKLLGEKTRLVHGSAGTAKQTMRRLEQAALLENGTGELIMENSAGDTDIVKRATELLKERETGSWESK